MLNFTGALKVYVATEAADLRKSFSGLYALATTVLREDPRTGGLFVFSNRRHTRVKVLYWDGTGLWVMTKRLEKGTFAWPKGLAEEQAKLTLRPEALAMLLDGIDVRGGELRPWYQR